MKNRSQTIDLRTLNLLPEAWRDLRLVAKALGVPVGIAAQLIVTEGLRQKRRQRKA